MAALDAKAIHLQHLNLSNDYQELKSGWDQFRKVAVTSSQNWGIKGVSADVSTTDPSMVRLKYLDRTVEFFFRSMLVPGSPKLTGKIEAFACSVREDGASQKIGEFNFDKFGMSDLQDNQGETYDLVGACDQIVLYFFLEALRH